MAINKSKNVMITATLSKADNEQLNIINKELSNFYGFELSKSQTISILIRQYKDSGIKQNQTEQLSKAEREEQHKQEILKYKTIVIALKEKLGVTYKQLSEMTGIYENSLKKFKNGQRAPSKQNKDTLDYAVKKYGIKI